MGIARSARADYEALDQGDPAQAATLAMFDAFAAGVNAWMARAASTGLLPLEYALLDEQPEPWRPWDACAIYKVRHALMGTMGDKLWRARVAATLGPEAVAALKSWHGVPTALIGQPGVVIPSTDRELAGADVITELWDWNAGSNSWAVHGSRSASGLPLLAGDPHRALDVPSAYYQNHLSCPEFDVIGLSFPGVPGFSHFGHNADVAWCITHGMADAQDLYVEHFDAAGTRYETEDGWMPAATRTEHIHVLGADPVELEITETRHGPIVVGSPRDGTALALRSTLTEPEFRGFAPFLPMLRARTVAELDECMRDWVDPINNLVMADRAGDIAFLFRGQVPIRSEASAWLPVPGWRGDHEWRGDIPFEELPRVRNPDQGFIVTANNAVTGPEYPYHLSIDFDEPHRAFRIAERLEGLTSATVDDMARIHSDVVSLTARAFIARLPVIAPSTSLEHAALAELHGWDHRMAANLPAPTIYAVWKEHLVALVLERTRLGELAGAPFVSALANPVANRVRAALVAQLVAGDDRLLVPAADGAGGAGTPTWDGLLAESFGSAVSWLEQHLGSDVEGWVWSGVHVTVPWHPLSGRFPDAQLDPPEVPLGGDDDTVQAAYYQELTDEGFAITNTSMARYVFDLADWDNSAWIVPLGGSGDPGSPHFADQVGTWAATRLMPMTYSWERIEARATSREVVDPRAVAAASAGGPGSLPPPV
jgi:penicillin amidase